MTKDQGARDEQSFASFRISEWETGLSSPSLDICQYNPAGDDECIVLYYDEVEDLVARLIKKLAERPRPRERT